MKKIHYAWFVCAGCALLLFCTSGLAVNAFSIYQPYIISLNHFTNTQASTMLAFRNFSSLISMFLVGKYHRKLGLRLGMTGSGIMMVAAFVIFGTAAKYWQYCLGAAVMGIGYGTGTMIPVAILISRWFTAKKDTAIGICSATTGLSTLGIPSLLSRSIETNGLHFTFCTEAAVIAVLAAACWFLLRNSPGEMGLFPYGAAPEQNGQTDQFGAERKENRGRDMSGAQLVIMVLMVFFVGGVMSVSYSHLTVLITGEGRSEAVAAVAMSLSGLALMLGKIMYGRLEDLWGTVKCNNLFGPVFLAGLALCCVFGKTPWLLYPAIILYSFGIAYLSIGLATWPSELASQKNHDRLVQIFQIGYAAGSLVFSPVPGMLADRAAGSYVTAYQLFLGLGVVVFLTVQFILLRQKKKCQ